MPRFKLVIEYTGSRYSGWQIQKNARTVAGEIDRAIRDVTRRGEFELYGAGRTDAGVHALAQVAHLELYTDLPPGSLRSRLNDALPSDIYIRRIEKASHRFHARHDAAARSYLYQISRRKTAFFKPYVWWIKEPLDVARMRDVERLLDPPHVRFEERRLPPADLIEVAPRGGVVACVETMRGLLDPADVNIRGQGIVEAAAKTSRRQIRIQLEMRDLRERVDPGVRATGAVQLELAAPGHVADRAIDFSRDCSRVLLDLPAAVPATGVFDDELETRHQEFGDLEI